MEPPTVSPAMSPATTPAADPATRPTTGRLIMTDIDLVKYAYPKASAQSLKIVEALCEANGLDITKKPYVIKPDGTILLSAAGYAMLAHNTGEYAGKDPVQFGEIVCVEYQGTEYDVSATATVTVYRTDERTGKCAFSHTVEFLEYASCRAHYRYPVMFLQKWATAQALRDAFTDVIGAHVSAEEMQANMDFSERKPSASKDMDFSERSKTADFSERSKTAGSSESKLSMSNVPLTPQQSTYIQNHPELVQCNRPASKADLIQQLDKSLAAIAGTKKSDQEKLIAEVFGD